MDDVKNRLARDLAAAMADAVAQSADVEACHERARAAGYQLKVTLEAAVGFAALAGHEVEATIEPGHLVVSTDEPVSLEVSASDRRFLRSLRIAADEMKVEEAN